MDFTYNYTMEESKAILATATDKQLTAISESVTTGSIRSYTEKVMLSPMAPVFQGRNKAGNDSMSFLPPHTAAGSAPFAVDLKKDVMNFHMSGSDMFYANVEQNSVGGNRNDVAALSNMNWNDVTSRNGEVVESFDFFIKNLSSAYDYKSMLTSEQMQVLRSIHPNLLYDILQDMADVRSEKRERLRGIVPMECAFCKNNGESEMCYASHVLKDGRGRVLCPILRAFRCPRCGSTGDHAHTIKYCPFNLEKARALQSSYGFASHRRMSPVFSSSQNGPQGHMGSVEPFNLSHLVPTTSAPLPVPTSLAYPSLWSNFGMN